ncbi:MAG: efflux RND transporter permease subunit [Deltaproteobacteria bacterium]|nr:efflux RND transporter permease subunit [Deltaproteobacteria bacterium]
MSEPTGSRSIYEVLVQRPVATIMGFLAAVVFGFVSYQSLPLNLMPDLDYPTLTVRTEYPGAAPGEVESQVSRPIEESLSTVPGLASLESISRAGMSDVILEFDWDSDMTDLSQAVRERLALLNLGEEVGRPLVLRYDPELDPMLRIAVGGKGDDVSDLVALRRLAEEEIKRAVETLPGVAAVKVLGGLEREVTVEVNEGMLAARGFTVEQLASRLQQENINLAGGSLLEGQTEYLIRTLNEFKAADEIESLYMFGDGGRSVRIGEVADVIERTKEREVVGRLGGAEAVEIAVFREADANIVEVSGRVQDAIFGTDVQKAWVAQQAEEKKKAEEEKKRASEGGDDESAAKGAKAKGKRAKKGSKGKGDKSKKGKKRKKRPSKRNPTGGMGGGRGGDKAFLAKQMTAYLAHDLPEGTELNVVSDQARFIESAINDVRSTALFGAFLAIIVLFVFLRHGWSTFLVGVAIPISVIVTFAPMYLFGVSLNLMSLGGMALCIGMLVDNSIVVLESVVRCQEEGDPPLQAAIRGASEVAGAVLASTLTTVAVFFPIAFVSGVAGQLFGHLALTVVFGLLASLAVALFLVPVLAALPAKINISRGGEGAATAPGAGVRFQPDPRAFFVGIRDDFRGIPQILRGGRWWGKPARLLGVLFVVALALVRFFILLPVVAVIWVVFKVARGISTVLGTVVGPLLRRRDPDKLGFFDRAFASFGATYARALRGALRRPSFVLIPSVLLLIGALRVGGTIGSELLPEVHQGVFLARVALPVGSPLDRTLDLVTRLEKGIARVDGVQSVYTSAGAEQDLGSSSDRGSNTAEMTVRLDPSDDPEATEERVREDVRTYIESEFDGVELELTAPTLFSLRTPLEVEVRGNDLDAMRTAADAAVVTLTDLPGLRDVRSNLQAGYPEIQIRYDRERLSRYGLDVGTVARAVRNKVQGNVATFLRGGTKKTDIRVILREDDRQTTDDLAALNVNPAGVPAIRLDSVADLIRATGPSEIRRSDQERAALIGADLIGFDLGSAALDVEKALRKVPTERDVRFEVGGQSREMEESLGSLQFALLLAVFLVYIIMASQFESVVQPLVILFALPLAIIGVVPALMVMDVAVSVIVLIGGIVLAGVVVNNAIVLVDYANHLRQGGMSTTDAVVQAGRVRLRPIIISTLTTVLGLMPMVVGMGEGSEIRRPLALTIIAGLSSSTLLTLGVIPVLYHLVLRGGRSDTDDGVP